MRAYISRIVAGPIAAFVAWLVGLGIEVGSDFETVLTETVILLAVAVVTSLYGIVHKLVDRWTNPLDAARDPETVQVRGKSL